MLKPEVCMKARLSRDARFDGLFFIAVKTTGIFCRPICPATIPKEKNVDYYQFADEACKAGYRPCLRCHPDSAPTSTTWKGIDTTLERAISLINDGALQENNLKELSCRLGISDRYLRQLFEKTLGVSPKVYALNRQCLFAKQLLHQTGLAINQVAIASGFNSVRRFNDCFKERMGLTPSHLRRGRAVVNGKLQLKLYYRPPYQWKIMQSFYARRTIIGMEWASENAYGRTFNWQGCQGKFTATHVSDKHRFDISLTLSDIKMLKPIVGNIRRMLDLDVDIQQIDELFKDKYSAKFNVVNGLRLPGIWSPFEAGIRAILGQQVTVTAAHKLVDKLVNELGVYIDDKVIFPTPQSIAESDFSFLKMPLARKQTLRNLAQHYLDSDTPNDVNKWEELKGIGPWTMDYVRMRGLSDPNIFLAQDSGVKNAISKMEHDFNSEYGSPWRSYLTFQLWNQLV